MNLRPVTQLAVIGATLASGPAAAAIHAVDCLTGPFVDIGSAVAAAAPGDTVLVRRCPSGPYAPFDVIGKERVHILAAQGAADAAEAAGAGLPAETFRPAVRIDGGGGLRCILIADSTGVSLQGFGIRGCSFHAIEVRRSTGTRIIRNRIDGGVEAIRDQSSTDSGYVGNLVVGAVFSMFLDGAGALVTDNTILRDQADGIVILGDDTHVVGNAVRLGGGAGILDQAAESRIERNVCLGNDGFAEIVLNSGSSNADVVSNVTGGSIADFGVGTELADNR